MVINGIFRTRTDCPWRDLPEGFGNWKTVYNRHRRWSGDGTWSQGAAANDKNPPAGPGREALGRSRGGLSTKIHLAADRRCRPVARLLNPGQHGDCPRFIPLMQAIRIGRRGLGRPRTRPGAAMDGKAYSSAANRAYLRKRGITAVIPVKEDQKANRRNRGRAGGRPPAFDAGRYKERNTAERCFGKLKQFRAVATRYEKRELMYQRHGCACAAIRSRSASSACTSASLRRRSA